MARPKGRKGMLRPTQVIKNMKKNAAANAKPHPEPTTVPVAKLGLDFVPDTEQITKPVAEIVRDSVTIPDPNHISEHVSVEASVVPVEQQDFSKLEQTEAATVVALEVLAESSVVPVEQQDISKLEQTEAATVVALEVLAEPSVVLVKQQDFLKLEQTEAATVVALEVLVEPSAYFQGWEKTCEGSLIHEEAEVFEDFSLDSPNAGSLPLLKRRASWWKCCGLIDVFCGARK